MLILRYFSNWELIEGVVQILTGLATIYSVYIAQRSIKELVMQRESAYIPDLEIDKFIYSISHKGNDVFSFKYFRNSNDISEINSGHESKIPAVNKIYAVIDNLGFGVAKKVEFNWDIDENNIINNLFEVLPEDIKLRVFDARPKLDIGTSFIATKSDTTDVFSIGDYMDKGKIKSIFPSTIENDIKFIELPEKVWKVIYYYTYYKHKDKTVGMITDLLDNFQTSTLTLKYQDIAGKKHQKIFSLDVFIYGFNNITENNKAPLYLEFTFEEKTK